MLRVRCSHVAVGSRALRIVHHDSWRKFVEDADSRHSNTLLQTRTRTVWSQYSSSHMLTLISMGCNRQSLFFCALSSSQDSRLLTRPPSQQLRAGFRPDCLLGIMRSALNVSPFCRMIGEALTSAPAVWRRPDESTRMTSYSQHLLSG